MGRIAMAAYGLDMRSMIDKNDTNCENAVIGGVRNKEAITHQMIDLFNNVTSMNLMAHQQLQNDYLALAYLSSGLYSTANSPSPNFSQQTPISSDNMSNYMDYSTSMYGQNHIWPAHAMGNGLLLGNLYSSIPTQTLSAQNPMNPYTAIREQKQRVAEHELFCKFCFVKACTTAKEQGVREPEAVEYGEWRRHSLHDSYGCVICPRLYSTQCRICGATGTLAHTTKHCPKKHEQQIAQMLSYLDGGLLPSPISPPFY